MSTITEPKTEPPASSRSGEAADRRRIVKKTPAPEPLARERRYVQPDSSHVSVFTGLFAWALRQNRGGGSAGRKVRMNRQSFGPDGLRAPTRHSRNQAKFANYFALGTEKDLKPLDSGHDINVHRNRTVFLVLLAVVVVYSLTWIIR